MIVIVHCLIAVAVNVVLAEHNSLTNGLINSCYSLHMRDVFADLTAVSQSEFSDSLDNHGVVKGLVDKLDSC